MGPGPGLAVAGNAGAGRRLWQRPVPARPAGPRGQSCRLRPVNGDAPGGTLMVVEDDHESVTDQVLDDVLEDLLRAQSRELRVGRDRAGRRYGAGQLGPGPVHAVQPARVPVRVQDGGRGGVQRERDPRIRYPDQLGAGGRRGRRRPARACAGRPPRHPRRPGQRQAPRRPASAALSGVRHGRAGSLSSLSTPPVTFRLAVTFPPHFAGESCPQETIRPSVTKRLTIRW
jgi:hypothetical protein